MTNTKTIRTPGKAMAVAFHLSLLAGAPVCVYAFTLLDRSTLTHRVFYVASTEGSRMCFALALPTLPKLYQQARNAEPVTLRLVATVQAAAV